MSAAVLGPFMLIGARRRARAASRAPPRARCWRSASRLLGVRRQRARGVRAAGRQPGPHQPLEHPAARRRRARRRSPAARPPIDRRLHPRRARPAAAWSRVVLPAARGLAAARRARRVDRAGRVGDARACCSRPRGSCPGTRSGCCRSPRSAADRRLLVASVALLRLHDGDRRAPGALLAILMRSNMNEFDLIAKLRARLGRRGDRVVVSVRRRCGRRARRRRRDASRRSTRSSRACTSGSRPRRCATSATSAWRPRSPTSPRWAP